MIERGGSKASWVWIMMAALFVRLAAAAPFAGGTGQPENPYQIATAKQLLSIGGNQELLTKHYVLLNDIDLDSKKPGGRVFTQPLIAPPWSADFSGTLNGQGHVIRRLTMRGNGGPGALGFFGNVGSSARVTDLGIEDADIRDGDRAVCVGGLAGTSDGLIANCYVTGHISAGGHAEAIGGLVGHNTGSVVNCHATGSVTAGAASSGIGGLVGTGHGSVVDCWTTSGVSAGDSGSCAVGGLIGFNMGNVATSWAGGSVSVGAGAKQAGGLVGDNRLAIANCYAISDVLAGKNANRMGGLVGDNGVGSAIHCFSSGKVTVGGNSERVGGLVGGVGGGIVDHCFWDKQTSGLSTSGGGTGLTTSEMQQARVFQEAGWDWIDEAANGTADLWMMPQWGYPMLTVFAPQHQPHELAGSGTAKDPYLLASAEDLGAMCHYDCLSSYKLATDIDLGGITWTVAPVPDFDGNFDGSGFTLSHLTIDGGAWLGLFGTLGPHATVTNLGIEDANTIIHDSNAGALASWNRGRISDCHATGVIRHRYSGPFGGVLGGLVGSNEGEITRCGAAVDIFAEDDADSLGGLTGFNSGRVVQCFAIANIDAGFHAFFLGGLIGRDLNVPSEESVSDSYAVGRLAPGNISRYLGGLVGYSGGRITRSYAAVSIAAGDQSEFLNGLSGGKGSVTKSFWDVDISGLTTSPGATGLTTTQMHTAAPFRAAGWDFENTWIICEGQDYPRLQWEQVPSR